MHYLTQTPFPQLNEVVGVKKGDGVAKPPGQQEDDESAGGRVENQLGAIARNLTEQSRRLDLLNSTVLGVVANSSARFDWVNKDVSGLQVDGANLKIGTIVLIYKRFSRRMSSDVAEVGDRYLGSVFWHFGTTESENLKRIPNYRMTMQIYRNTDTESWVGNLQFQYFEPFCKPL